MLIKLEGCVKIMIKNEMVKENAVFVLESDHILSLDKYSTSFKIKEYEYGKTYITILNKL